MVEFINSIAETITESLASASVKVDADAHVIRGVKLIGFESRNGRSYPPATLRSGVERYEGVPVNIDHPARPTDARSVRDRIGVIRAARYEEGRGIFGDFHYNPKHAAAEQIVWDAQNNPAAVGFSHNANLHVNRKSGKVVVESIAGVRSMDLVADPATTSGFFESVTDDTFATEGVIADKIAQDEKWRELHKVVEAARRLISEQLYNKENDVVPVAVSAITKISTDLISELSSLTPGTTEGVDMDLKDMTVAQILEQRKDLAELVQKSGSPTLEEVQKELEGLKTEKRKLEFAAAVDKELSESSLTVEQITEPFKKTLLATESADERAALIKDREACFEGQQAKTKKPTTTAVTEGAGALTAESLVTSLRRR